LNPGMCKIFLFSTMSRPALGSTQPTQLVVETLYPGIKCPGREADHSHPSSADIKDGRNIPPLPLVSSCPDA
jgi:hypothetical protein